MKTKKTPVKPRKFPAQERSQFTVDAILEASAYILSNRPWEDFTTNKIAEKSGVNIASLYQYFPNKESILAELYRKHFEDVKKRHAHFQEADLSQLGLHDLLELVVKECVNSHTTEPKLQKILREKVPKSVWWADASWDRKSEEAMESLIVAKATTLRNKKFAGFFLRTGIGSFIHEAIDRHPEYLEDPEFITEMVRFFEAYLVSGEAK